MNASNFSLSVTLSQLNDCHLLPIFVFFSQKFKPSEINYVLYDELVVIVSMLEEWQPYLVGSQHHINVITTIKT